MFRILTKTGVENTNDDGVRDSFFNSGMRSGIVKGSLNECNLFASASNVLAIDTCELRLCGHRVVIDEVYSITFSTKPQHNTRYSIIATINNTDNIQFSIDIQSSTTQLVQANLNKTTGKYQLELGKFTLTTDGTIEDVVRTADLITGGVGNGDGNADFQIGNVITNEIKYNLNAEVDIKKRYDSATKQTLVDVTIQSPTDFSDLEHKLEEGLGKTIQNIEKTGTNGLVDTYTITFTNGNKTTFTVTNGKGITNIVKTSTSGLADTYTITFNDNTTSTFIVTNGAKGDTGDIGLTPQITASATTLSSDSQATVTQSGTVENPTFVFGIPKGEKGDKGDTGARGPSGESTLPIGMIISSAIELTDARFHLLDGGTIAKNGIYSEFATMLGTLYPNGDYTSTQYENDIANYEQCGHFVIGTDTIRLPKITKFIEGLSNISDLGKSYGAGLPNIQGSIGDNTSGTNGLYDNMNFSGAFSISSTANADRPAYSTSGRGAKVSFDASNSNSIYGNSTTVQPQSTAYPYYIVLANGYKSEVQIDIDNITTELNNKADKTLSNVTYPTITVGATTTGTADRVIKQYLSSDGMTWYRVFVSGWKECGFFVSGKKNTDIPVTTPIAFSNTNYIIQMTNVWTSSGAHAGAWDPGGFTHKTTNSFLAVFTTWNSNVPTNVQCQIYCCGY